MPGVDAGEYLIEWLSRDLGWCSVDAMGSFRPHPWAEIEAFARIVAPDIEPWEGQQIRAMSAAYVDGLHLGADVYAVSPMDEGKVDPDAERRARVAEGMRAQMAARAAMFGGG